MADERLQKVLARAGISSRRAAEELIVKGRVKVDGRVIDELGVRVDPRRAKIEVDGNRLMPEQLVYIVLHKPRGVMCTLSDPEGRPTVAELLKSVGARVVPVGRLDFHTSGALLCTNDGDFANALAHPSSKSKKVYVAKVQGLVQDDQLAEWRKSIEIDGRPTAPAEVRRLRFDGDKTWLELTLREGRNRQVRRLGEATGSLVMRLARISQAGINAEDLRPGQWRHLSVDELVTLKRDYGVPKRVRAAGSEAWDTQNKANARVSRDHEVRAPLKKRGKAATAGPARDSRRGDAGVEPRAPRVPRGQQRFAPEVPNELANPDSSVRGDRFDSRARFAREKKMAKLAARGVRVAPLHSDLRAPAKPARPDAPRGGKRSDARPERQSTRGAPRPDARFDARPDRSSSSRGPARSEARPDRSSSSRGPARPEARPDRSSSSRGPARPEARPDRSSTTRGPARSEARPDRSSTTRGPARSEARPDRPNSRISARPDTRKPPAKSAGARESGRVQGGTSSRGERGSSRRRGT